MNHNVFELEVEDLSVRVSETDAQIVRDVSFAVAAREILGLVGESGSGKTTVALALLGYARSGLEISSGRVIVDGRDVVALSEQQVRQLRGVKVAYVPQDPATALNPALKIRTQLLEMLVRQNLTKAQQQGRLGELLAEVALDPASVLDVYPHQLSGGQQQRVALATAFALKPSVIVLDEPTTGLDVTTQRHVLDMTRQLCMNHGVAAVFVSHDLAVVAELVDHVAVMYGGQIVEIGSAEEVFGHASHPYTRGLLRAVPSPDRTEVIVGMPGQPPRAQIEFRGCAFAPRCSFRAAECVAHVPRLVTVTPRHQARCTRLREVVRARPPRAEILDMRVSRQTPQVIVEVRDVRARYGSREVLHGVDLRLAAHECLAVVGESGSGKTTLARCIVGLHQNWTGEVMLSSVPLAPYARKRRPEQLRTIQYIFQNPFGSLNPRRSVQHSLELALAQFVRVDKRERERRVSNALEAAALDPDLRHRVPSELSGGQRQRVAIARALLLEPEVIVCDEITSALDVSVQSVIVATLRTLQRERNLALVFITHNLALVRSVAHRVVVMYHGSIVETGATAKVLEEPAHEYTQSLLRDAPRPYVQGESIGVTQPQPSGPPW